MEHVEARLDTAEFENDGLTQMNIDIVAAGCVDCDAVFGAKFGEGQDVEH